jgi:hypothetical protein
VRESRTLGSVGAKPNGCATRPQPAAVLFDVWEISEMAPPWWRFHEACVPERPALHASGRVFAHTWFCSLGKADW